MNMIGLKTQRKILIVNIETIIFLEKVKMDNHLMTGRVYLVVLHGHIMNIQMIIIFIILLNFNQI